LRFIAGRLVFRGIVDLDVVPYLFEGPERGLSAIDPVDGQAYATVIIGDRFGAVDSSVQEGFRRFDFCSFHALFISWLESPVV